MDLVGPYHDPGTVGVGLKAGEGLRRQVRPSKVCRRA